MAVLRRAGHEEIREGTSVTCEVGDGAKGPLVLNVLNIDSPAATAACAIRASSRREPRPSTTLGARSNGSSLRPGYGFISPDGGAARMSEFIHITALRRQQQVTTLGPGQRVRMEVVDGKKGQEADSISLDLTHACSRHAATIQGCIAEPPAPKCLQVRFRGLYFPVCHPVRLRTGAARSRRSG